MISSRTENLLAHDWWQVMTALNTDYGAFTLRTLNLVARPDRIALLKKYIDFLNDEGVLTSVKVGPLSLDGWSIRRRGETPPLRRAPSDKLSRHQQALYTAMRNLPSFSLVELRAAASTDVEAIAQTTMLEYVRELKKSGLVIQKTEKPVAVYRLLRAANTGPRAPIFKPDGRWFDMNLMHNNLGRARP